MRACPGTRRPLALAFSSINLLTNPFGELDPGMRAELAVGALAVDEGEAVQVVAPSGRGKTTMLLALSRCLPRAVYERVEAGSGRLERVFAGCRAGVYLIDDAQRLGRRHLRQAARARTLVLASHRDLSTELPRPLRTAALPALSPIVLEAIVRSRVEAARRGPGPLPMPSRGRLEFLLARHGSDVRAVFDELYELYQRIDGYDDARL